VKGNGGNQLFGLFDRLCACLINKELTILSISDTKLIEMVLEFLTKLFHGRHIRKKDRLHDPLFNQSDFRPGKLAAKEVVIGYV